MFDAIQRYEQLTPKRRSVTVCEYCIACMQAVNWQTIEVYQATGNFVGLHSSRVGYCLQTCKYGTGPVRNKSFYQSINKQL